MNKTLITLALSFSSLMTFTFAQAWEIGPFERADDVNPIIFPKQGSSFFCPLQKKEVPWEGDHTFNPAAVVHKGKIFLFYRAEDDYGQGIGRHTSRLGLAKSSDGVHFKRFSSPIFFPDNDDQSVHEWPGGCEDPRIVEREDGTYVMTYTQWNHQIAVLGIATSQDLLHWKKHGYAFEQANNGAFGRRWSKSGSIICRCEGDKLIAAKLQDKYWMYWGEGLIYAAVSDDLISWEPLVDDKGDLLVVLKPRPGKFDSKLVEPGPPAILTKDGIVLLYNGKNSADEDGDSTLVAGAYSAGQLLFDPNDPTKIIKQTDNCFFKPERPYETKGQYQDGTVFIQGLVRFHGRWFLYYGGADSIVGVAVSQDG